MYTPLTFDILQEANAERNKHWDPEGKLSKLFFATELAGEVGELCNVVKKLEREALGLPGSRAGEFDLANELADVAIVLALLANEYGINLGTSIEAKFNATSRKLNLPVFIA